MERMNPTNALDVGLTSYIEKKKTLFGAHMQGGIPDYAYGLDFSLRQKLKAIPGFYALARAITNTFVPAMKQQLNLDAIRVGPSQFPDIYEMSVDCARTLGIGIPTVFIKPETAVINAGALAVEDDTPLIILNSALVERFTPGEIKAVLGHECGHIHNNHGIYNTAAELILNALQVSFPGVNQILQLVSVPLRWAFNSWSRAAEVTCDRAGVICTGTVEDSLHTMAKFMYGSMMNRTDVNIEDAMKQYEALRSTPVRILELEYDHPVPIRRMFALKEFVNSETLLRWHPEMRTPDMQPISKQELDERCEKYIGVIKSEKAR